MNVFIQGCFYSAHSEHDKDNLEALLKRQSRVLSNFVAKESSVGKLKDDAAAFNALKDREKKMREEYLASASQYIDQRSALLTGIFIGKKPKDEFVLLVDGSGSMNGTPIYAALDGVVVLQKSCERAGAPQPAFALCGASQPVWIKADLDDSTERLKISESLGPGVGADTAPSIKEVHKLAAVNTLEKKKTHVIYISDGDLIDCAETREAVKKMLATNPKVTVDFVIMERKGYKNLAVDLLASEMQKAFPGQARKHVVTTDAMFHPDFSLGVQQAVLGIATDRLTAPAPGRKRAPKP